MSEADGGERRILWAPWRAAYVRQSRDAGCVFCEALGDERSPENLVLWRGESVFVMMNRFPYAPGHLMVSPVRHVKDLEGLSSEESMALFGSIKEAIRVLGGCLSCEGFNVGINLGKVAGAGFAEHLHVHIVPRWNGDCNFMPVLADTRVISESISETYAKLREGFDLLR
jgi:ATP adenylyltransferase